MGLIGLVAVASAATWVVDAGGAGDFTSVQAAIDAAAAGDRIEVRAGTYPEWSGYEGLYGAPLRIGKSLEIAGEGVDRVRIVPAVGAAATRTAAVLSTGGTYDAVIHNLSIETSVGGADGGNYAYAAISEGHAYDAAVGSLTLRNVAIRMPAARAKALFYKNDGDFSIRVENSVIDFGPHQGSALYANRGTGTSWFRNSVLVNVGLSNEIPAAYTMTTVGGVPSGTGNLVAAPAFVDAAAMDYALQPGSPAIDAGDPAPAWNDRDGTRNDLGVYGGPAAATPCPALHEELLRAGVPVCIEPGAVVPDSVVMGERAAVAAGAFLAPRVVLDPRARVQAGAALGRRATVGSYAVVSGGAARAVTIGAGARLEAGATLGYAASLGAAAVAGAGGIVGNLATIGARSELGASARIGREARVEEDVVAGDGLAVGPGATLGAGAVVGADVTLKRGATVGDATLGDDVIVGRDAIVLDGVTLGAGAVLRAGACAGVSVPAGVTVGRGVSTCP